MTPEQERSIFGGAWPYNGPKPLPKEMEILRARMSQAIKSAAADALANQTDGEILLRAAAIRQGCDPMIDPPCPACAARGGE